MQFTQNCGSDSDDRKFSTSMGVVVQIFSSAMQALSLELAVIASALSRQAVLTIKDCANI